MTRDPQSSRPIMPPAPLRRMNHYCGHPTVGPVYTAIFRQPLTGARRTVQVVRYAGAESWKGQILETCAVISRLGVQAEFATAAQARNTIKQLLSARGMQVESDEWAESYPTPATGIQAAPGVEMIH